MNHKVYSKSLQLATITDRINLQYQSLKYLKTITCPIIPICTVGPILMGKSTLLNDLIGKEVFDTDSTTNPTTHGIWMYPHFISGNQNSTGQMCYLFIDSQGFDQLQYKNNQIDFRIMLFMCTFCKYVLYVNRGALQSSLFGRISKVIDILPNNLKISANFILVQKDFSLKLLDTFGQPLTAEQYLEFSLENLKNTNHLSTIIKYCSNNNEQEGCQLPHKKIQIKLFPNRLQKQNYRRILKSTRRSIFSFDLHSTLLNVELVFRLEQIIQILNFNLSDSPLLLNQHQSIATIAIRFKNLQEQIQNKQSQYKKICELQYRNYLTDQIQRSKILEQLPLPIQLIEFKIHQIMQQYFNRTTNTLQNGKYLRRIIGQQKVKQIKEKLQKKLEIDNTSKIAKFIQGELEKLINIQRVNNNLAKLVKFVQKNKDNLYGSYSFLHNSKHDAVIQKQIWYKISERLCFSISQLSNSHQSEVQSVLKQLNKTAQEKNNIERNLQNKEEIIKRIQEQNNKYKQQLQVISENQQQFSHLRQKFSHYHQILQHNYEQQINLCTGFKETFIENIISSQERSHLNQLEIKKQTINIDWQNKLYKIQEHILTHNISTNKTIADQKQRIVELQKTNNMLRQRLSQLHQNTTLDMIQSKYQQLQEQYRILQNKIVFRTHEKERQVQSLRKQAQSGYKANERQKQEIQILRSSLKDKGKGSQFMQKLLMQKDSIIEELRSQLLTNIENTRRQINIFTKDHNNKVSQLSDALTTLTLKNEKLLVELAASKEKLEISENKMQKGYKAIISEKQQQYTELNGEFTKIQVSIESATEAYREVTDKLQMIIRHKQNEITNLTDTILRVTNDKETFQNKYQSVSDKYHQISHELNAQQIQKDRIDNQHKRNITLLQHKCKHLQNNASRLKLEIKEKQCTFDVMLRQLRSQNIIKYGMAGGKKDLEGKKESNYEIIEQKILLDLNMLETKKSQVLKYKDMDKNQNNIYNKFHTAERLSHHKTGISNKNENYSSKENTSCHKQISSPIRPQNLKQNFENQSPLEGRFAITTNQHSKPKNYRNLIKLGQVTTLQQYKKLKNQDFITNTRIDHQKHKYSAQSLSTVGFKTVTKR